MADQSRPEGGTGGVGECLGGQQKGPTFSHSADVEVDLRCWLQIQNQELAHTYKTSLLGCLAYVQRLAKVGAPGLVNFTTAVAYHFCPSVPATFTQAGAWTLADFS